MSVGGCVCPNTHNRQLRQTVRVSVFCRKLIVKVYLLKILSLKGHQNCMIGSKVTAILLKSGFCPIFYLESKAEQRHRHGRTEPETRRNGEGDTSKRSRRHGKMESETPWNGAGDTAEQNRRHGRTVTEKRPNDSNDLKEQ